MQALPVSDYQTRFFIEWALRPGEDGYNVFGVYRIRGPLDTDRFRRACARFVRQHEEVRAVYAEDGSACHAADHAFDALYRHVLADSDTAAMQCVEDALRAPFDLVRGPILRFLLVSVGDEEHVFAHVAHHIVCDGEMLKILGEDIAGHYHALASPAADDDDAVDVDTRFRDAVAAERRLLAQARAGEADTFWRDFLGDVPTRLRLPLRPGVDADRLDDDVASRRVASTFFALSPAQTQRLHDFAEARETSVFVCLAAMYGLVLSKFCSQSSQKRFFLHYPVNVRPPGCGRAGGCFVNNLPMKMEADRHATLDDWIAALTAQRIEVKPHQRHPFAKIARAQAQHDSMPLDGMLLNGTFNVGFVSTNLRARNALRLDGLETETVDIARRHAIYDLSLLYDGHDAGGLRFRLDTRAALFDASFADAFIASLRTLVDEAVDHGRTIDLARHGVLVDAALDDALHLANPDTRDYETDTSIPALLRRQAARTPDAIATIEAGGVARTYAALRADVDRLAWRLLASDGALIGILAEKGHRQSVATLAVMQSGHAYLPLNVEWPLGRVLDVLACGGVRTLLVSREQRARIALDADRFAHLAILDLDDDLSSASANDDAADFPAVSGDDIAYVIFTSGSTGTPKGVTISHAGALNTLHAVNERFGIGTDDRVLALSDLAFDLSVYDLFGPLLVGGATVFPAQADIRHFEVLADTVQRHRVTVWNSVPQLADLLVNATALRGGELDTLRLMLLSGDWIPVGLPADIRKHCTRDDLQLVSLGGATEGSIWSVWHPIGDVDPAWTSIPYGRAMPNQTLYVLDDDDGLLPVDAPGHLCIGGAGVAVDYWNDAARTAASFFVHPTLGRLYRTGDRGTLRRAGHIEFGGRTDFQLKIRGYRVEPGDIEAHLSAHPGIRQSVVQAMPHPGSTRRSLVAWYVADRRLDDTALAAHLGDRLPDYMVPGAFVQLAELPLTANGKVDRAALPMPAASNIADTHAAPEGRTEHVVAGLFAAVLGLEPATVSAQADFFRLGGDSIAAVRLIGRINRAFPHAGIRVIDVFRFRTVRTLADAIDRDGQERHSLIKPMNDATSARLLFMIHPATGGCEVYHGLAELLADDYRCYGIDNRNLHGDTQVSDLHALAESYLALIRAVRRERGVPDDAEYTLTGWSLGGQIAFAIAARLEAEGVTAIRIISLDAILNDGDDALRAIRARIAVNRDAFRRGLEARRAENRLYDNEDYIQRILAMVETEKTLALAPVGRPLRHTRVLLFKTMRPYLNLDINPDAATLSDHVATLPWNNVDHLVHDPTHRHVHPLDCDHGTLLLEWERIAEVIRETCGVTRGEEAVV